MNSPWQSKFTESETVVLAPGVSGHSPVIISVKIFNFWRNHSEFDAKTTVWGIDLPKKSLMPFFNKAGQ